MPTLHPMPDPIAERLPGRPYSPFATVPRSPTWDMAGASQEPQDPPYGVIRVAIWAALEALADAQLYGSEAAIEVAEARLERYQQVADRHERKEDDHPSDDFEGVEDDWSDVVWLDEEGGDHGA